MPGSKRSNTFEWFTESLNSGFTSASQELSRVDNSGITLDVTGTPTGEFFVDAGNDGTAWVPQSFVEGQVLASGAAVVHGLSFKQFTFKYIRIRYVFSSGTGSVTAKMTTKQI